MEVMANVKDRIVDTIVLELDIHEARILRSVLDRIAGDPVNSDRRYTSRINYALSDFGIHQYNWYVEDDSEIRGGIEFKTFGKGFESG